MDSCLSTIVTLASGYGKKNSKKYLLSLLDRELSLKSLGSGKAQVLDLSTMRTSPGPPDGHGTSFSVCVAGSGKKVKLTTLNPDDDTAGWSQVVLIVNAKKVRQGVGILGEEQKQKKRRKSVSAIASKLRGVPERKEVDTFDEQDVEKLSVKVIIDGNTTKEVVIGNGVRTGEVVQSVLDREGTDVLDYLLRSKGGSELSLNASLGNADSPSVIFLTPRPRKEGSTDDDEEKSPEQIFQLITIRFADEDLTRKVVAQQPTKLKVLLKQLLQRTGQSYKTYTVTQDGARIDYNKLVGEDSTPMEFTLSRLAPVALPPAEVPRICITIEDAKRTVAVPKLVPIKNVLQEALDRSGRKLSDYLVILEDGREHNLDRIVGLPDSPVEVALVEKSNGLALDFDFLDPTGNEWILNVLSEGVTLPKLFQRPIFDEEEAVNYLYQESTKFVADYEGSEVKYVDDHSVLIRTLFGLSRLKYDGDMPIKDMFMNLFNKAAQSYKVRVGEYLDKMELRFEEFQTAWDNLTKPAEGDETSSIGLLQMAEELKAQKFEVSELIDESFLPDRRADKLRYTREEPKSKIFGFMKKKENYLSSDVPVPIVDLSRVVDASGNFSMKFFVAVFSAQFSVNFSKFRQLTVPRLLKGLGHGVKLMHGSLDPTIFQDFEVLGRDYDARLEALSSNLKSFKVPPAPPRSESAPHMVSGYSVEVLDERTR
eukprot:TRINITY_DN802_c1_g1_i3.p1 TRINITY_DN802_c1_g1~~TRINITY_DN802_c1_g1_i3.p1  ORF type:complete len:722 (-),score=162.27 TRINITY_DN802_c1_g1_i3:382-2505(-)